MTISGSPPLPKQQPVPLANQSKPSLLEAIAAASASFGDLAKDAKNDYLKTSYMSLPGLLKAVKRPLLEQGVVVYSVITTNTAGSLVVRTTLALAGGGEEMSSDFPVIDISNVNKVGAAVTYGTRYNLFALLAVCPDDDDDGAFASYGGSKSATPPQPPSLPRSTPQQPAAAMPPAMTNPVQPLPVLQ